MQDMNRWILTVVAAIAAIGLAIPVHAQNASQDVGSQTPEQRIEARKQRLQTNLDSAATKRIADRCKGAQTKLAATAEKVAANNGDVLAKYEGYITRVTALEQTLASNNVKSSDLLAQLGTLKQKYETLDSAVANLKIAIDDAKTVNCTENPAGFKAAVDDARAQAKTVKQARVDLRQFVITALKPTLTSLKEVN